MPRSILLRLTDIRDAIAGIDDLVASAGFDAFARGGAERVTRLHRRDDLPEAECRLRAPGWCLAYR